MQTPSIIITLDSKVVGRKRLDKEVTTIGRAQDNDIVINNLAISRYHAMICKKDSKLLIKDLGSANGTFVNKLRVEEAELKAGDIILIGKHALIYKQGVSSSEEKLVQRDEGTVMVDAKTQEEFLKKLKGEQLSKSPKLILSDGKEVEIKSDPFTIGRMDKSNLKIDELFVKSPHAKIIRRTDGAYTMVSMGSFIRPTKINGIRIKEKTLQGGDIIKIGKHVMVFAL